ncbi:MAG: endonuclease/exonuclease/phosphatase family protein [Fidelibacterota bacterium]
MNAQDCPPADTVAVTPVQNLWQMPFVNDWQGLEVMTWNLKEFPLSGNTVSYVNEIIHDLQPDIIVFQEIIDLNQFQNLVNSLGAYSYLHTNYEGDGGFTNLNLGMAFRNESVDLESNELLFLGYGYEFAWRYPLKINLLWHCGLSAISFQLVIVHFKCCDNGFERRLAASEILHGYIIDEMTYNGQQNIIVAGDFNDNPGDAQGSNSLWPLVNDESNMLFTTLEIIGDPSQSSYPWYYPPSFLDHILISSGLYDENTSAVIQTFRPDDYMGTSIYQQNVSDHRPVIWKSPLEEIDFPTGIVISEIMNNPNAVSDSYGEWFELTNVGAEIIHLDGLIIHDGNTDTHTIQSGGQLILPPSEYIVLGRNGDPELNGGLSLDYVYSGMNLNNTFDGITIQHPVGYVLDSVYYDNGGTFPNTPGRSMMLIDPLTDNSLGSNWVESSQLMDNGDFGTPGENNFSLSCEAVGDINNDGASDVLDLVSIVGFILGNTIFDEEQVCRADLNSDNIVNVSDIVILVGLILQGS